MNILLYSSFFFIFFNLHCFIYSVTRQIFNLPYLQTFLFTNYIYSNDYFQKRKYEIVILTFELKSLIIHANKVFIPLLGSKVKVSSTSFFVPIKVVRQTKYFVQYFTSFHIKFHSDFCKLSALSLLLLHTLLIGMVTFFYILTENKLNKEIQIIKIK